MCWCPANHCACVLLIIAVFSTHYCAGSLIIIALVPCSSLQCYPAQRSSSALLIVVLVPCSSLCWCPAHCCAGALLIVALVPGLHCAGTLLIIVLVPCSSLRWCPAHHCAGALLISTLVPCSALRWYPTHCCAGALLIVALVPENLVGWIRMPKTIWKGLSLKFHCNMSNFNYFQTMAALKRGNGVSTVTRPFLNDEDLVSSVSSSVSLSVSSASCSFQFPQEQLFMCGRFSLWDSDRQT